MATTKITSNVLALSAAQTNINNDGSFTLSVPTLINNTVSVSGNLTVDTNTLFVDSVNNRVGIGTISPAVNFHVSEGISRFERSSVVFNITPNYTGLGNVALDVSTNNGIIFRTNNTDRAVISNTGSVGIGTITPTAGYALDVVGAAKISGNILCSGSILYLNSQQSLTQGTNSLTLGAATYFTTINYGNASTTLHNFAAGKVGIGTATPAAKFEVWTTYIGPTIPALGASNIGFSFLEVAGKYGLIGGVLSNGNCYLQAQRVDATATAYNLLLQSNGGNVGIGTTTPLTKFDVNAGSALYLNAFNVYGASTTGAGSVFGKISNSNTAGRTLLAFSETPADASTPAFIERYGSTHSTKPNALVVGSSGSLELQTNATTRLFITTSGNVGIGTETPNEKLTVVGNISASGNVTASNLVYTTGDQTIADAKTFSDNIVGNGTANRLPNQLAVASSDIIIKGLADSRYASRNKRITDDTTFLQTTWEQFLDFDDQYNADLTLLAAFGGTTFGVSPAVFGDTWIPGNVYAPGFTGNDLYTHRGVFLVRGPTASNQAFYIGINRTTTPYYLTNRIDEFTCRVFVGSTDFTTQGYFKIGIIPKGGTGGTDQSLRGGLIFNPYLHATNLVLGVPKAATASPFTFTNTSANVDFLDTGVNFINLLDKWVNITYKIDRSAAFPIITIIIVRENVVLFQASYDIATDPVVSTWARRIDLYALGASNEIGIQNGKFTYTARSNLHIDYLHYKVTGTSAAPSNWNSLRF